MGGPGSGRPKGSNGTRVVGGARDTRATAFLDEHAAFTDDEARRARSEIGSEYAVSVTIEGSKPLLCHRYDCDSVGTKGAAKKGSVSKRTDDIESYLYRDPDTKHLGIPGVNFKAMLAVAAKSFSDPRSPRKSMFELLRASITVREDISPFLPPRVTQDFIHKARVCVQRAAITRCRPGFQKGWRLTFVIDVNDAQYVSPELLREIVDTAGRRIGLGDFRPDYGVFRVVGWEEVKLT